ncbi:Txe/YoeB family addiction module toxin [Deinococcus sp. SDU3-2]|uniref:Putative mRNA interferase YoeB n=1 Tax=Deinococcus terrestris TaxID=2651870 RepID=A0A7X1NY75_9DEIO|nr:Txe/YoeB family addiction module toxin [Deinococcus terrestris]MPY67684.1 Txe/YoeB family addiction module toxin [Deinococcus terrestris]MPY67740.1 Txe/YoeB family addiction module toxin [Deinococcus terrestris]
MRLVFSPEALEDSLFWQEQGGKTLGKINELIRATARDPFSGPGKPEPLRHQLQGWWSRRITLEHRLVYRVSGDDLLIASLRFHYED